NGCTKKAGNSMADPDWTKPEAQSLAALMRFDEHLWNADELGAILAHQLDTSLQFDFDRMEGATPRGSGAYGREGAVATFRQLLLATENPPLELLERTKQFAKQCRNRPDGPLPDEVATVLY